MRALPAYLLVTLLLAPPLVDAQSAPPPGSVWTVFTTVEADVQENYAVVRVIADIANRGPDPEFPFVVRVPDDAFVTGLLIERDGTVYEAEVKDREAARQEYEAWKAQEQTGGLVEKTRRTSVYSYLVNVAEFTNARAVLTYERYLAADRGVYDLSLEAPVSGFGQDLGARFVVKVSDSDGVVGVWGEPAGVVQGNSITFEVGPRAGVEFPTPFTASYTLEPTDGAGTLLTSVVDNKGYFVHRFRAPADAQELPMDLVMVLDTSGSMAGLKLQQMVDASKQVVQSLRDEDRLHLVSFSSDARSSWTGLLEMTPENRKKAAREIDALFDGGGTNIEAGLRRGFAGVNGIDWAQEEGRFPALVLLTDGQPTAGVTSRQDLRALSDSLNARDIPVFGIAFGDDADWTLIRALAQEAEGAAVRVPLGQGAEVDLRRFMAALTTPVLRDVRIAYGESVVATITAAPVLFASSELLVVGTFDPARGIRGTVEAMAPDGARRFSFTGGEPSTLPFLPRLVAYHEVRALQEEEEAEGASARSTARIKELALRHGFVTDHTSLVVTLPPRELREWQAASTDARRDSDGSNASACCAPPAGQAPKTVALGDQASTDGGMPFRARAVPEDATQSRYEAVATTPAGPREGEPQPAVPGPGAALVVLAVAGVALGLARRSHRR